MTFPVGLIFVGIGLMFVGVKGYKADRFFFHGETVPA